MKRLVVVMVLWCSPVFAGTGKFQGYVIDAAAFRKISSFCVDTHDLPPDRVKLINHLIQEESKAHGLLTKLPWRRRGTCGPGVDAILRLEFPNSLSSFLDDDVEGALLLFRPGSPSPIYETPAVASPADDSGLDLRSITYVLAYAAARYAVLILIHDWQQR